MINELQNMVAVITGAGSGIGRALANKLAANGCSLALADIDPSGLQETVNLLPSSCKATSYKLDVSDREAFQAFVKQVVADHQHVDILINNAGIVRLHSIQAGEYDDFEVSLNVNVWGVLYGCKEFLPYLKMRPKAWLQSDTGSSTTARWRSASRACALRNRSHSSWRPMMAATWRCTRARSRTRPIDRPLTSSTATSAMPGSFTSRQRSAKLPYAPMNRSRKSLRSRDVVEGRKQVTLLLPPPRT